MRHPVSRYLIGFVLVLTLLLLGPVNYVLAKPIVVADNMPEQTTGEILSEGAQDIALDQIEPTIIQNFSIEIPQIGLVRDIEKNINPTISEEYLPAIERNVAHGKGTALPSNPDGNTYLFAHSFAATGPNTPDGGWFTRLDELTYGDSIIIRFNGQTYTYTVDQIFTVDPYFEEIYTAHSRYDDARSLTLQTCYPRGDNSGRLIIIAKGV